MAEQTQVPEIHGVPEAGDRPREAARRSFSDGGQPTGDLPHPQAEDPPGFSACTGTVDRAIVEVAKANPTDGTRMVAALASREIDRPISRKRAQRVMRSERLLQRHRPSGRRRRPGHFRVERPDQLWK